MINKDLLTETTADALKKSIKEAADFKYALVESCIVAITDQKGTINYANDNFCKISKYSREELIGQDHRIINSGFHSKEFIKNLWTTIANGEIWRGELKNKAKDGTYYWVDTTIVPFLNSEGKPYQYVASRADITSRKEIEEHLTKSLKEISDYKYAIDESSIVAITDQKGIIKYVNNNFCKISKYSREELIGQDHRIINSGFHPKEFIRNLWVTIAHGKIWRGELKNKAKDGTHYWVDTTIVPFLDEHGKPYQYVAIRADITARKETEEYLEKSLKEVSDYKYAIEESSIVAITDQKGIIKYVNDNFCKISKYSRNELIGQDHRIINSKSHPKEFIRKLWVTIANGKIWRGELKNKAKDGTFYWVDTTIVPFLDERGKPSQYIAIRADITERKRCEQLIMANIELTFQNEEIEKRATELIIANKELAFQSDEKEMRATELIIANKELAFQNAEKEKRAKELIVANMELAFQNEEKGKRAAELIIANKELAFQNVEKEKRAKELIVANMELAFQNEEKGKRARELIVANVELAFQNEEKEKRATELIIANKELAFQSDEKEKRATELIIANKELAFQNHEKEKRASELDLANKELAFQSKEKEKRATELIIANKELAFQNEEKEKKAEELSIANWELKKAEEDIRKLNKEDIRKLNEELEQKVVSRTAQLESANQELESFSYSVSHDLRTPLRAVNGYARILEEDYAGLFDSEGKRMLAVVQNNAKKMGVLIDDLLAFSRLGRKEVKKSMVNMNALVENALIELNTSQQFKGVIKINDLHPATGDTTLMHQVWVNLLSNAIKYSSNNKKPVIKIDSEKKNNELIYSISDNGVGFDMKYVHKLFGVFQRLHSSEDFEGTGVGLALVHRIINKQGGKIWAKAEINKGATFYFSLPGKASN
jgi:PAS domain S-box-containing protein